MEGRRPARAVAWIAAAGSVATLAAALIATQLLARFADAPPEDASAPAALLSGASALDRGEIALAALLALARLALALRPRSRRLAWPLLDLPLLALVGATSGGTFSPLDPALPLVYLAAVALLRAHESGAQRPAHFASALLGGLLAGHLVVHRHDARRLAARREQFAAALAGQRLALDEEGGVALRSIDESLAGLDPREEQLALRAALVDHGAALEQFLRALPAASGADDVAATRGELALAHERASDRWFAAREAWRAQGGHADPLRVESLDLLRESFANLRVELAARAEEIERGLRRAREQGGLEAAFLRDAHWRRAALAVALLAGAGVVVWLRARLAATVRDAEARRAELKLELSARETGHWIAVTAGLTHGLGNDIVAYDAWLREAAALLEGAPGGAARARDRVLQVAASNRGRLAFLRFLDELARQRQAAAGDAAPLPTEPLDLEKLLRDARARIAEVECADLPAPGVDPAADRRRSLLGGLPLEIEVATPEARTLRRGRRGALEFIAYELLKNALRSATGERPLRAQLRRDGAALQLELANDVEIERAPGRCARRRRDADAACERCFESALRELLEQSFAPGRGAGTGLGLFLIGYFLRTFWDGRLEARVVDAGVPLVAFTVTLPDPSADDASVPHPVL